MNTIAIFAALISVAAATYQTVYTVPTTWTTAGRPTTYAATAPVAWNSAWNGQTWNAASVPVVKSAWTAPATTWNTQYSASTPVAQTAWTGHQMPANTWNTQTRSGVAPTTHTTGQQWNSQWNTPTNTWNTQTRSGVAPSTHTTGQHWNSQWNTPVNHWDTQWNVQPKSAQHYTATVPATTTYKTGAVAVPAWNYNTYAASWPVQTTGYQWVY